MIPLAIAAATAAAQYYNSQKDRENQKANSSANRALLNSIPLPEFATYDDPSINGRLDPSMLDYQNYTYGGDYDPTQAAYAQEVGPTTVEQSTNAKFGRDAQLEALKKYQSNLSSGYDPEFAAKMDQASRSSQADAQSRINSILESAARKGQGGTNATLAAQLQSSSDAMDRGSQQSQAAAVAAYQNQLQQTRDAASLGGTVARDENQLASENANIVNSFNARASKGYQDYLNARASTENQAQLRNLNSRQSLDNANIDINNRQTTDQYNAAGKERAYQNQLIGQKNSLTQNDFNNQMSRATGNINLNNDAANDASSYASGTNKMIQGAGDTFAGYYQDQDDKATAAAAEDRADNRARMQANATRAAAMYNGGRTY